MLLAVLITLGLMEKANEVTAMKATGISIYRVVTPVIVLTAMGHNIDGYMVLCHQRRSA